MPKKIDPKNDFSDAALAKVRAERMGSGHMTHDIQRGAQMGVQNRPSQIKERDVPMLHPLAEDRIARFVKIRRMGDSEYQQKKNREDDAQFAETMARRKAAYKKETGQ